MDSSKLKPCPFCGSSDVEAFAQYKDDCPDRSAIVRCHGCDAQSAQILGQNIIAVAARKWNSRVDPLKSKCDALAAESAARGEIIDRLIGQYSAAGYHAVENSLNPAQSLLYGAMQVMKQPATDAYLNSVRAEAVESFAHHQRVIADATPAAAFQLHRRFAAGLAEDFAAQLRAGKDGE